MQKRRPTTSHVHEVADRSLRSGRRRVLVVSGIAALALLACLSVASPALAATAHADAGDPLHLNPDCKACHKPHTAPTKRSLLAGEDESAVCFACHDDAVASDWNIETGAANSFDAGMSSGHSLEEDNDTVGPVDLTNSCTGCHGVHGDPDIKANLPANELVAGGTIDPTKPRTWCLSCHNADHAWYAGSETGGVFAVDAGRKIAYDALVQDPARDASHYPDEGTFPGADFYATSTSLHANIPAWEIESAVNPGEPVTRVAGDCLWCHASHRSDASYDGLLAEYGPSDPTDTTTGSYAQACFECHGNSSEGRASEIYTSTSGAPLDDAYWAAADAGVDAAGAADIYSLVTAGAERSGHRIKSASGAFYAQGSPLPCYECHNPHGSKNGNTVMISDALGGNLDPRGTEAKVRQFCFSCHTTADTGAGWDSDANNDGVHTDGVYTLTLANTAAGATVVGLPRAAAEPLKLPNISGHRVGDTTKSCLSCHGTAHNPTGGVSPGGIECSLCHSALNGMVNSTSSYHHVLDDPNWDQAPNAGGTYPTSTQSLSCVSCHVDHSDYESLPASDPTKADGKAFSLRSSALDSTPVPTDTDDALCLSCHTTELARNTTGQKANAIQETSVWKIDATLWGASPHNYDSPGPFDDGSTFYANCAKCHGNLQGTLSSGKFSVHYSAEQRLLNALGDDSAAALAVNEEQMCFRCHSKTADFVANGGTLPGTPKPYDNKDWYGTQDMSESNVVIYAQMTAGANTFGHKPHVYANQHLLSEADETQAYISANKHVECADCHNHHVVGDARHEWGTTNDVSEAIQGVTGQQFSSAALTTLSTVVGMPTTTQINTGLTWMGESNGYASKEYAVCFKCHSSENTNLAAWGGTKPGAVSTNRWTNVAAEVSVGNQSRHPVIAPNNAYPDTTTYGTSRVAAGQLSGIWEPGDTMYCSDCHGDSRAPLAGDPDNSNHAQGPHGSSVQYSLRGPNTSWPTNSGGTLWTIDMVEVAVVTPGAELPFCANCHLNIKGNQAHIKNAKHQSGPCTQCHIQIPHGGAMSRLIGDGNGAMPARYAYNNNKSTMKVASFRKQPNPLNYTVADCSVTDSGCVAGGKPHTVGNITSAGYENW